MGRLFEQGLNLSFDVIPSLNPAGVGPTVVQNLPSYPWDHSNTYWFESRLSRDYRLRRDPHHDLLGVRIPSSTSIEPRWRYLVDLDSLPWLSQHVVDGSVAFPGAGYMCMAIEALKQLTKESLLIASPHSFILKDVAFVKALRIPSSPEKVEIQIGLSSEPLSHYKYPTIKCKFRITALSQEKIWYEHCRGYIKLTPGSRTSQGDRQEPMRPMEVDSLQSISPNAFYRDLGLNGNVYGQKFAMVTSLDLGNCWAQANIAIPDISAVMPSEFMQSHVVHPTTLDALMHSSLALYSQRFGPGPIMPVYIYEIVISSNIEKAPGKQLLVHNTFTPNGTRSGKVSLQVFNLLRRLKDSISEPVISASGLEMRGLGDTQVTISKSHERLTT